jgi:predicted patatin/cPLA2 family phospholipase
MKKELALVCGDGGIKGGFIAGVVSALMDSFPEDIMNVKTIAASSASVGSMFYFLSHGRSHPGREIWINALASKEFIKYDSIFSIYSKRPIYDIDHLVYKIFKQDYPLNIDAIKNSPIEFYFPLQNYNTREVEYFSNCESHLFVRRDKFVKVHDFRRHDVYDLIRAASAAPFVYDQPVKIGDSYYIDAATLEPYVLDLPALRGKKTIVAVTKSNFSFGRNLYYYLSGILWPFLVAPFKANRLSRQMYFQYMRKPALMKRMQESAELLQCAGDLLFFKPVAKLGSNTDNSSNTLKRNFSHGEDLVSLRAKEIEYFLSH